MYELGFLFVLALVWIIAATICDLKKREVPNWLNFSLIIFALGGRFLFSLFSNAGFGFFYQGLIGLAIFFVLGNLFYYIRLFAGGDAKLMIALGAIIPLSSSFLTNLRFFLLFLFTFFIIGAVYSLLASFGYSIKNYKKFKKEFKKIINKNKKIMYPVILIGLMLMLLGFLEFYLFYFGVLIFVLPYLYIYTKAVDESCMVRNINTKNLVEGDWLYKDVNVGKKLIKADWNGLKKKDVDYIKKHKRNVVVRYGVPFSPVFLISFLIFIYLFISGLGYSFW